MENYLIKNVRVVNEGRITPADVLLKGERIEKIDSRIDTSINVKEINGDGKLLLPGVIDDQVHFREPGLTRKGNIYTESRAGVAGGVTSFMEMPNTVPPALTQALLEEKYKIAAATSLANFSFFMGTSNDNEDEVLRTNDRKKEICGVKIFMGSSTGNMLVDNPGILETLFRECELPVATHCESEKIIRDNYTRLIREKGSLSPADHPLVRDVEACYQSTLFAIQLAQKNRTRLHILHLSTAKELSLFSNLLPSAEKNITCEVCVHHLHFSAVDYDRLGYRIKCNPAIKDPVNREGLWGALLDGRIDIIATDHAPHLPEEKEPPYEQAHSGLPLIQHSLPLMLHYHSQGRISLEKIVEKMCHTVADIFQVKDRGYIREGYYADLILVDPAKPLTVDKQNLLYRCGWSPFEGFTFPASITHTFVNGHLMYENGKFDESKKGKRLFFNR